MKKILFYCQYLAGMGHLVRSTEIIRSLVKEFQVCFVNGGEPIAEFEMPANLDIVHLPPIVEAGGELRSVDQSQTIETVKAVRTQMLLAIFEQFQPDCVITECFPFSKHKLKYELLPLLERAKAASKPVQVVCSLRDLIMTQSRSTQSWNKRYDDVCELINRYYDLVLVHGDSQLLRLDDQFPKVNQLNCEVYYTGYVAQSPERSSFPEGLAALHQNKSKIVASVGGGRFGYSLLNAVVNASDTLSQTIPHHIYAFTGPFMPAEQVSQLHQAIAQNENLTLRRYTPHLINYMAQADLSISLGGYNTTMNILQTGVRSLIFPEAAEEQAGEQTIRAKKLAEKGVLAVLSADDLQGDRLAQKIQTALQQQPIPHAFNLHGADHSAVRLKALLYSQLAAV